jgi:hypothetical protein
LTAACAYLLVRGAEEGLSPISSYRLACFDPFILHFTAPDQAHLLLLLVLPLTGLLSVISI